MIIILGMDGLEHEYVEKFDCKHLKQKHYGTTDLSEFTQPRTMIIWSSFLTGKCMEKEILETKNLWEFNLETKDTFFSHFESHEAIDVPGYSYITEHHDKEREMMKLFFAKSDEDGKTENQDQEQKNNEEEPQNTENRRPTIEEYDKVCFNNHRHVKDLFMSKLENPPEILMAYFALPDVIGHVSFGVELKMKLIYEEMDKIAQFVQEKFNCPILIISDHGMQPIGRYGDHSDHGFWSWNIDKNMGKPKPTEFFEEMRKLKAGE